MGQFQVGGKFGHHYYLLVGFSLFEIIFPMFLLKCMARIKSSTYPISSQYYYLFNFFFFQENSSNLARAEWFFWIMSPLFYRIFSSSFPQLLSFNIVEFWHWSANVLGKIETAMFASTVSYCIIRCFIADRMCKLWAKKVQTNIYKSDTRFG